MENEQLDKIARDVAEKVYPKSDGNPYYSTARDIFVGAFKQGYNYPKWVSVKDALPNDRERVLIVDSNGSHHIAEFYPNCVLPDYYWDCDEYGFSKNEIEFWMPLQPLPTK